MASVAINEMEEEFKKFLAANDRGYEKPGFKIRKEDIAMTACVVSGTALLLGMFTPLLSVGFMVGTALWGTTIISSYLTKRFSDQTRQKIREQNNLCREFNNQVQSGVDAGQVAFDTAIAVADAVTDVMLIDYLLDGEMDSLPVLGGIVVVGAVAAAAAAPPYAVYQRFKNMPKIEVPGANLKEIFDEKLTDYKAPAQEPATTPEPSVRKTVLSTLSRR